MVWVLRDSRQTHRHGLLYADCLQCGIDQHRELVLESDGYAKSRIASELTCHVFGGGGGGGIARSTRRLASAELLCAMEIGLYCASKEAR